MTQPLQTSVGLRHFQPDDAERLADLLNDSDVSAMTSSIPFPYEVEDARAFLTSAAQDQGRQISRAIVQAGALVGGISLDVRPGGAEELGYWVGKPFWGQGIASQAVACFVQLLAARGVQGPIAAQTAVSNEASQRVLLKNGFAFAGTGECITPARATAKVASKRYVLEQLS